MEAVAARAFGPVSFACMEGSSLLVSGIAKPWHGRALASCGGSGALLEPWVLRGMVVTFGLEGPKTVAGAWSSGLRR